MSAKKQSKPNAAGGSPRPASKRTTLKKPADNPKPQPAGDPDGAGMTAGKLPLWHESEPDRLRVVELAAQLVVAQISSWPAAEENGVPRRLDAEQYDQMFAGAMGRARSLLRPPSEDHTVIHAEQLFNPGEVLTAENIAARFKEAGWPGLTVTNSVAVFLGKITAWMDEYLTMQQEAALNAMFGEEDPEVLFVRQLFEGCDALIGASSDEGVLESTRRVAKAIERFAFDLIRNPGGDDRDAQKFHRGYLEYLARGCLNGRSPGACYRLSPTKRHAVVSDHAGGAGRDSEGGGPVEDTDPTGDPPRFFGSCRAYHLFRYVRKYGANRWKSCPEIQAKLQIERCQMRPEIVPNEIASDHERIHEFDQAFEEYLDQGLSKVRKAVEPCLVPAMPPELAGGGILEGADSAPDEAKPQHA